MASPAAILELFPAQGEWTEEDYYFLDGRGRLVELSGGNIEVLPRLTELHQRTLIRLFAALFNVANQVGYLRCGPLPTHLWPGTVREPDLIFMTLAHADRIGEYWGVPDLAAEITTADTSDLDRRIKRAEYEQAGVQEYWIIDPETRSAEVIRFGIESHILGPNDTVSSPMFPGWSYKLADLFAPED